MVSADTTSEAPGHFEVRRFVFLPKRSSASLRARLCLLLRPVRALHDRQHACTRMHSAHACTAHKPAHESTTHTHTHSWHLTEIPVAASFHISTTADVMALAASGCCRGRAPAWRSESTRTMGRKARRRSKLLVVHMASRKCAQGDACARQQVHHGTHAELHPTALRPNLVPGHRPTPCSSVRERGTRMSRRRGRQRRSDRLLPGHTRVYHT